LKTVLTASIVEIQKADTNSYRDRDYEIKLFEVTIEGRSTSEVEEKVGKLQQALTHMGWKLN
jgi:hypothetical protein